jgi:protein O-GlcNAcase/histone acetyltransferase
MSHDPDRGFLAGVIEGFYGPPWSVAERNELLDWMAAWGLDTYLYAPKDDLKHRAAWRTSYDSIEAESLRAMIHGCQRRGIRFVYALSPGLDIRYGDSTDRRHVFARLDQVLGLGCDDFALLFDDIPDRMSEEDRRRWGSFASAQCDVVREAFRWVRERRPQARFLFCPTAYCERMVRHQKGGADYLETIGRELPAGIDVFWTGPEIISGQIPVSHVRELTRLMGRPPLIWDNLHANDYDGRRFYCGPYSGRPPELRGEVSGVLCNPNSEFALNFVPLRTFSLWLRCQEGWDPRAAYLSAMREWLTRFETLAGPASLDDLVLLGDCYYLPHEEGSEAQLLLEQARGLLTDSPARCQSLAAGFLDQAMRLRDYCARLAELRDRPLFYALHRRLWELREELDLWIGFVKARLADPTAEFRSDYHLPGTYRSGLAASLQRLLTLRSDGVFRPAHVARETQGVPQEEH